MKKECQEINKLLVDYADGQLSGDIAAEVTGHMAHCPACQAKVKALGRSLAAAQAIWRDTEKTVPGTVSFMWRKYAAMAAGIVVIGVAALLWNMQSKPAPTFDQMENSIAQAASAARILAAADILAAQEGGQQAATEQYQLISESYKNTPSGKEVLSRMKSTERRI